MAKTAAIIFDVYKTLLDNETDEGRQETYEFLSRWLSYHQVRIAPPELRTLYLDLCHEEIGKSGEPYPDIDIGRVFSSIIVRNGGPTPAPGPMVSELALLFRMLTTKRLSPIPGVIAMLGSLRGKARLGIASNAQRLFTIPELDRFGLLAFFEAVVFSSDVGVCKPGPTIFAAALDALAARPEVTLFVGDNLLADIQGAQSVGMRAVWIDRDQQGGEHERIVPEFEVRDVWSLTELLLSML